MANSPSAAFACCACGLAPVVMVGEKTYGRVSPEMVKDILQEYEE